MLMLLFFSFSIQSLVHSIFTFFLCVFSNIAGVVVVLFFSVHIRTYFIQRD